MPRCTPRARRGGGRSSPTACSPGRWRRSWCCWSWRSSSCRPSCMCWRRALRDNPEQLALTVDLARITFPYLILTLVAVQLSAMLNAIEKFWAAAAWSNFQNLAMIATLLAWHWFPNAAYAAAWGVFAGRRGAADLHPLGRRARRLELAHLPGRAGRRRSRSSSRRFGAVTFGAASVVHRAVHRHDPRQSICPPAAAPRFIMPTASTSCRWACWASRWARCCCRKCRRGWPRRPRRRRMRRRTARRRCACC